MTIRTQRLCTASRAWRFGGNRRGVRRKPETMIGTQPRRRRPPRRPRPAIRNAGRSLPAATASEPTAANSPSGIAGPTRPRSCSSSTAEAPASTPRRAHSPASTTGEGELRLEHLGRGSGTQGRDLRLRPRGQPVPRLQLHLRPVRTGVVHPGDINRKYSPKLTVQLESAVRPLAVVVLHEDAMHVLELAAVEDQQPVEALRANCATNRSAIAFACGARTGVFTIRM